VTSLCEVGTDLPANIRGIIATPLVTRVASSMAAESAATVADPGALARIGSAEEAANVIAFLLSDESSFVNGMVYGVDGGWMC
jgi:NAD(P)-dependent dehydrogenase (short-subunit alcohol dehydrogenase family)